MTPPLLFTPHALRGLALRNRIVVSPMCQYASVDGFASDWHLVHLGKFAQGGAALVFAEATAVQRHGRITHGDLGIWSDAHVPQLARVTDFIRGQGAVAGIQLSHAGRKAATQRPWHGNGPLAAQDLEERGEAPWPIVAPSALAIDDGWLVPEALDAGGLAGVRDAFAAAAGRALRAGFEVVELHAAHGYLLHQFLSPLTNLRTDAYGGDRKGRMRFPLEVIQAVRAAWPQQLPLFVRVSAVDGLPGGWDIEDTVAFAKEAKALGADVIDCSSGGLVRPAMASFATKPSPGYQVPYARRVREEAGIASMAVGLIFEPAHAEGVLARGDADLVALARGMLDDPNWPLHAAAALGHDAFAQLADVYAFFLRRRARVLEELREPQREPVAA